MKREGRREREGGKRNKEQKANRQKSSTSSQVTEVRDMKNPNRTPPCRPVLLPVATTERNNFQPKRHHREMGPRVDNIKFMLCLIAKQKNPLLEYTYM